MLLLAILLSAGCAKIDTPRTIVVQPPVSQQIIVSAHPDNEAVFAHEPAWGLTEFSVHPQPSEDPQPVTSLWTRLINGYGLGHVEHRRVTQEMRHLSRHRPSFDKLLGRGTDYLHFLLDAVEQRGLPTELALLPAIESGYRPFAYSPDGAAGLWQFMPATAQRFGLEMDWWYDARRDVVTSTEAALDYLEHLHKRFDGDWLRALAAYNAGGAKVARAAHRNRRHGKPTDFWSLELPRETDRYVPRLLALAHLIANPAAFGLVLPELGDRPRLTVVDAGSQTDLRVAARVAEVPLEQFAAMNAGYNRSATRPEGPHRFVVPTEAEPRLRTALADLTDSQRLRWARHRIRRGDTLAAIARRHGVRVDAIKRANQLNSNRIIAGDDILIPLSAAVETPLASLTEQAKPIGYRVRKGDSLYVIARRFGVSVNELRRWNRIPGRLIKPGQRLLVYVGAPHMDATTLSSPG